MIMKRVCVTRKVHKRGFQTRVIVKRMSILKSHGKEIGKTTSKDEYVFSGLYEGENGCMGSSEVEIKNGPHTT